MKLQPQPTMEFLILLTMLVYIVDITGASDSNSNIDSKLCTKGVKTLPIVSLEMGTVGTYSGVGPSAEKFPVDKTNTPIRLNKYYGVKRDRFYAKNTGETLIIQFEENAQQSEATLRGYKWDDEYVLAKGIVLWGTEDNRGSQHSIKGQKYSLELQLLHYAKKHGNLETAAKNKAGILVVCILFEAVGKVNKEAQPLAQAALSTTFPNVKPKQIHGPLDIKKLFPTDPIYFQHVAPTRFQPCAQEATWIVFRRPVPISTFQLTYFRGMRDDSDVKIGNLFDDPNNTVSKIGIFSSSKLTEIIVTNEVSLGNNAGRFKKSQLIRITIIFSLLIHLI